MSQETTLDFQPEHKKSALEFKTKEFLMLGAGPTNVPDRIFKAYSRQSYLPLSEEIFTLMDEVKKLLQYVFQTKNRLTVAGQTSGSGGNETIIANLLDPGDKIVIAIGGHWGEAQHDMAKRHKLDPLPLRKPPGEIYTLEELEEAVKKHKADVLFVTHGESTGGTLQNLEGVGAMCHKYGCLLAVDSVISLGIEPLFVDRWELDAVNAGTQKGLSAPPGMCLLTFSERAEKRIMAKKVRPPYYLDMKLLGTYWKCFGDTRGYIYTLSSNLLAAVREALAQICEEGLENSWRKHRSTATLFWQKAEELGFGLFVKKPENRSHGVTCVQVPEGINYMELLKFLQEKYNIMITPGAGPSVGTIRVGFMGCNCRPEVVEYLVKALKDGLEQFENNSAHLNSKI